MKTFIKILMTIFVMNTTACVASYPASNAPGTQSTAYTSPQQPGSVSLQLFYDELSPYGTWVSYNNYGYVWVPNAGPDFYPYSTAGHWVFTDIGWTWYSDYSWGWAPFHYGRWFNDPQYGWMWVPDTEWGPAWVTWRSGSDYYGWAPIEPGISISIVLGGGYQVPQDRWIFVRNRDIERSNVSNYTVNRTNNMTIVNNTTIIQNTRSNTHNNVTYITGPDRNDVQQVTGKPVREVAIQDHTRPGQNVNKHEMQIYKPRVQRDEDLGRKTAPAKVENLNNVKPVSERYQGQPQHKNQDQNKGKQNHPDKKKGNDKKPPLTDNGNNKKNEND